VNAKILVVDDDPDILGGPPTRGSLPRVILMTAYGSIERAVEAMKLGAYDFL